MLTERQISADSPDQQPIRKLYAEAFPLDERIPWEKMLSWAPRMPLDITAYYDNDRFIGMTVVYLRKDFHWFWYFAVRKDLRGQGYGQRILTRLLAKYNDSAIILDMESPDQTDCGNLEQRRRRCRFYERNGFSDTYIRRQFDDLEFTIMMRGDVLFTLEDYDDLLNELRAYWEEMPSPTEHQSM